jgi:hypothetical protein
MEKQVRKGKRWQQQGPQQNPSRPATRCRGVHSGHANGSTIAGATPQAHDFRRAVNDFLNYGHPWVSFQKLRRISAAVLEISQLQTHYLHCEDVTASAFRKRFTDSELVWDPKRAANFSPVSQENSELV